MKLLIIHNKYQTNNIGGEDIVYENELAGLRQALGESNVFSYDVSNDDISKFKLLFSIWFSFKHYFVIKKLVKRESIDIVHVHNFYPLLTPSIFRAAKKSGAKVVHTLHNYRLWCISGILYRDDAGVCELCTKKTLPLSGILNRCYRASLFQSVIAQASFVFYKLIKSFSYIDYFFVLTNFQKQKVISLGIPEHKIILKPNSIASPNLEQKYKNGYVFVGRLEASKGIYSLLDTWLKLDGEIRLTIVGGGEIEEELRRKYKQDNIIFKGKCSRDKTLNIISESKYLVQSSLWYETFGLTIVEAMSLSTPVIGFDIGTRGDFIQDGLNGFLCDEQSLFDVINKSFNYCDYSQLSKNAKIKSRDFTNEKVFKDQIETYKGFL